MSEQFHPHTSGSVVSALMAHERGRPRFGHAAVPSETRDDIPDQIITALRARRLRVFEMGTAAVITDAGVEGRIRLRIDDGRWSLATVEASVIALLLTVDPDLPHASTFAHAFRRAAVDAELKVEALNAWSRAVRPTEDLEDGGAAA